MAKKDAAQAAAEEQTVPASAVAAATQGGAVAPLKVGQLAENVPSFLADHAAANKGKGLEDTLAYIRPSRLKVIQKQSASELLQKFNIGDIILADSGHVVAPVNLNEAHKPDPVKGGKPFYFVPLLYFSEYALWNPYVPGKLPPIRARSFDPQSDIAKRARNADLWAEECPEEKGKQMRYCEHLVFVVSLLGDAYFPGDLFAMSFLRGSYKYGLRMMSLLNSRRNPQTGDKLALFSGQYAGRSLYDPGKGSGDYWALSVDNPAEDSGYSAFVQNADFFAEYEKLHDKLKEAHAAKLIEVDYDAEAQQYATGGGEPGNSKDF